MVKRALYLLALTLCVLSSDKVHAATLYIDPGIATIYRGDAITMSVRIMPNSEIGECINVIDAVITYPENIQPVDVSIGQSIFNVWVEQPTINRENRTVTFAGGISNGYCGRVEGDPGLTNVVADIIFRSPGLQIGSTAEGNTAVIGFGPETQVYLNDGQGTKAPLTLLPSTITLEKTAGSGGIVDEWRNEVQEDTLPPEEFSISLERDEVAFSGAYFIVFSTTDKQTGLSHFEVMEEPLNQLGAFAWGGTEVPWIRTQSPYVLQDQTLNSTIRVKAFDKAGNEYIATFIPDESLRTAAPGSGFAPALIIAGAVIFLLAGLAVWFALRRRARAKLEVSTSETVL